VRSHPTRAEPRPASEHAAADQAAAQLARAQDQQQRLLAMLRPVRLRDTTEPQHDPSAALRRLVQVRDLRCTGPGCPRTASSCDLDHEVEYAQGGPTSEPNLSAKSPRCHRAKHNGWTADRDRTTGSTTWTSPDGSTFTRRPAWRPHPWHPEVVLPPLPRLQQLPEAETDYPLDRPLWIPPRLPERPKPAASTPARPKPAGRSWDDGGPPPF
jgi:5-methylcytosine-specific restriction endonuclease McrA